MIISLHKKILTDTIQTVSRFAEKKVLALPALSGIAIQARGNEIIFRATNIETGIEMRVEGTVKKEGMVAVPAGVFRDIVSSFSGDGVVSLEMSGDTLVVSSGKSKSVVKTLPFDDIPTLTVPEGVKIKHTVPGAILRSLIGAVSNYASPSTVRPELASVYINAEGGMFFAVATDSFRLAEKKVAIPGVVPTFSMLIPAKNAQEIMQHIPDTEVTLFVDEHQCSVTWSGVVIVTRLVAMSYPDYKQIIPKTSLAQATLLKKDFETALKRTSVFSDTFQKIKLTFNQTQKHITLFSQNADVGEAKEELSASLTGEDIELSFNHRYLFAPLPSITAESIELSAAGIGRPLVVRPTGDSSFLYLVMPMNN